MKTTIQKILTVLAAFLFIGAADSFAQKDTLSATDPMFGGEELVDMPFRKAGKDEIVSAVGKLDVSKVGQYDHNIWINDVTTGRIVGVMGANNIRGIGVGIDVASETGTGTQSGNTLFIVDGLPRDISTLRMSEVESITVLKDANAAVLYGTQAINGVIMITTKRGYVGKSKASVDFNYGLRSPIELPSYMGSADYMTWYNQARANDGLDPLYSDEEIANYRNGNPYRYPSMEFYSDQWLRKSKNYYDINAEFSGGNKMVKYYVNAGFNSQGSLIDFGQWKSARNNTINVRTNIDLKINDWINTEVDATAMFRDNKTGRGNFWNAAYTTRPNLYAPLLPINLIDSENKVLLARKNDVDGQFIFGGTTNYTSSAFSNGYAGGLFNGVGRRYTFNDRLNFDLDAITEGLSFHTNMSFDYGIFFNETVYNNVSVYQPTWAEDEDKITAITQIGTDSRPGTKTVATPYFQRRMGFSSTLSYDRTFDDVHHVTANVLAFANQYKWRLGDADNDTETEGTEAQFQGLKQAHLGFQASYSYDKRYIVDFSGNYANSVKLAPGHNREFSPTAGVAWIVSNEEFMQGLSFVDYLKLHVNGGILKGDVGIDGFFLYDAIYGGSGTFYWNDSGRSQSGRIASRGGNENLRLERRNEITGGIEGQLFGNVLGFEVNGFYEKYSGQVVRANTLWPGFYSAYTPYENYNVDSYRGIEAGLSLNKRWGDFSVFAAANIMYVKSNMDVRSEIYDEDYLYRVGHPVDGTWALESLGLFQSAEEIAGSPVQTYGDVRPGDIKYKDQNGDNKIDDNDQIFVRKWNPPFTGGVQLKLSYKGFTLYALGNANWGKDYATFIENNYYWVDATDPYPTHVKDSWTPQNPNAKWPALTTAAANNNNRRSTFWMYDNSFFQLRKVQLSYALPEKVCKKMLMSGLQLYVDCTNPIQFAPNRIYRQTTVNGEPSYRGYSFGLRASF